MELEPAIDALSLLHDLDDTRRLDLIYLDVSNVGDDEQVEFKKRKVKRLRRKQSSSASSPLTPDSQTVGSLSEDVSLPHPLTRDLKPNALSLDAVQREGEEEEIEPPSIPFTDFVWPQAKIEVPDESASCSRQTSLVTDQSSFKDSDCDFTRSIGYVGQFIMGMQ